MKGSCLCGAVVFEVSVMKHPSVWGRLALHGSSVSQLGQRLAAQPDWFRIVKGATSLEMRTTDSGKNRLMCTQCEAIVL